MGYEDQMLCGVRGGGWGRGWGRGPCSAAFSAHSCALSSSLKRYVEWPSFEQCEGVVCVWGATGLPFIDCLTSRG